MTLNYFSTSALYTLLRFWIMEAVDALQAPRLQDSVRVVPEGKTYVMIPEGEYCKILTIICI